MYLVLTEFPNTGTVTSATSVRQAQKGKYKACQTGWMNQSECVPMITYPCDETFEVITWERRNHDESCVFVTCLLLYSWIPNHGQTQPLNYYQIYSSILTSFITNVFLLLVRATIQLMKVARLTRQILMSSTDPQNMESITVSLSILPLRSRRD